MRKTSRSFLTVGTILGFVFGALMIIAGFVGILLGTTKNPDLIEPFLELINQFFKGSVQKFQDAALVYGVFVLLAGMCSIASGVLCIIAKGKPKKGLLITVIVVCAMGGSAFGALGAIFGLVANGQDSRRQQQAPYYEQPAPQPEPEQPKDDQAQ